MNREGSAREVFLYQGRTLEDWLPAVVERIVERFDPLKIILFGSVAPARWVTTADLDLLVVFGYVEWENKRRLSADIRVAVGTCRYR